MTVAQRVYEGVFFRFPSSITLQPAIRVFLYSWLARIVAWYLRRLSAGGHSNLPPCFILGGNQFPHKTFLFVHTLS